jgi:hypothetical protein
MMMLIVMFGFILVNFTFMASFMYYYCYYYYYYFIKQDLKFMFNLIIAIKMLK